MYCRIAILEACYCIYLRHDDKKTLEFESSDMDLLNESFGSGNHVQLDSILFGFIS